MYYIDDMLDTTTMDLQETVTACVQCSLYMYYAYIQCVHVDVLYVHVLCIHTMCTCGRPCIMHTYNVYDIVLCIHTMCTSI